LQCKTIGRIKFERNRKLTTPIFDHSIILQRKLFISSLQKISTQAEVDIRKAELERAFRKYGGARGVTCIVPTNTTFAFVEMENERMADLALSEMSEKYRLNRARRSRHEALQEKRADAEAAKAGKSEDTGGW
jgi:RNA recognition motif-containing protein